MHFYLYNSGAAAVFMCLRMDVLTVKRRRWWEGGGGDSATVAVHQQRWDYSHHYITVCRLERADGATLSLVPAKNTLCLFCFHSWTHKISRTPVQSRQCTWRDWLSCSFVLHHFSRQTVMAEGQLSRPTLPQLPHMPEETNRPTVGSSMCVISADPDALKHCPVTALHCIPRITPYSSLLAVIMGLNSLCHWNATQIKCHQRNNGEVKLNWETTLRMRLLILRRNRALCSVQCNLISETKASGSGERYITYEQTPSRPESTASLKYHLVAVPFIRDLVQGRKYSLISFKQKPNSVSHCRDLDSWLKDRSSLFLS